MSVSPTKRDISRRRFLGHRVVRWFLNGLALLAPLAITLFVIYQLIVFFDGMLRNVVPEGFFFPGIGLLIVLIVITFVGFLSDTLVFRPVVQWIIRRVEDLFSRIPLLKVVYSVVRDIMTVLGSKESKLGTPVLVCIDEQVNLWRVGFLTQERVFSGEANSGEEMVAVYVPHSYNFSGNLLIVERKKVRPLRGVDSVELLKFIISGGMVSVRREEQTEASQQPSAE